MKKKYNKKYDKLIKLFINWNRKINLSAIREINDIKIKHIQDSLIGNNIIREYIDRNRVYTVCDIGTGSGFPLLPLSLENPSWQFISIESVGKKVKAVRDIAEKMNIKNIEFIWDRAENVKNLQVDVLVARAVAYIDKLLKFSYHLVKPGGFFVFYKLNSLKEFEDLKKLLKKFNIRLEKKYVYKLFPTDIERVIYVLQKK